MQRRDFLRLAGGAALAPALGGVLPGLERAAALPRSAGRRRQKAARPVKLGFIALTDCASLVMAQELGFFADRDLDVTLEKQASWPATRDALLNGQIDGAHALFSLPFSVATGIGGTAGDTSLKIAMVLSNNGQGITLANEFASVGYGNLKRTRKALETKTPTMAMTFPGGTHDLWLRYWLQAAQVDAKAVQIIPIPPPQMVANMKVGTMDGYSVGEPWNAVGAQQGIGFTTMTSQDIWQNHPEKALIVNDQFATTQKSTLRDLMGAIFDASKWLDDFSHRAKTAEVIGAAEYVNAPAEEIKGRLEGRYDLGGSLGKKTFKGPDRNMVFFRGGQANAPRRAHAIWFMAQYQRLGYLDTAPDYLAIADSILLRDVYEKVAAAEKIDVPDDDMAPFEVKLDGVTFDPAKPKEETRRL